MKLDLHVHANYSDGSGTIEEVIATAEEKGLDGIALTDHSVIDGIYEARRRSCKVLVIPGCEVCTEFGHIIALGIERTLPFKLGYKDELQLTRGLGGISVLAHPYAGRPRSAVWVRCKPDAIEVVNALYPFFNYLTGKSRQLDESLGLPQVAGSDAHSALNVGDAYTLEEADSLKVEVTLTGTFYDLSG